MMHVLFVKNKKKITKEIILFLIQKVEKLSVKIYKYYVLIVINKNQHFKYILLKKKKRKEKEKNSLAIQLTNIYF